MKALPIHLLAAGAASIGWSGAALGQEAEKDDQPLPVSLFQQDRTKDFIDLTASLGYSSSPSLNGNGNNGDGGSVFARGSVRGVHSWLGPLSSTSISGYVEGSVYPSGGRGLESIFAVDAAHSQRTSETVTLFGSVGASGDISGQLSNRFLGTNPIILDPSLPPPPTNVNDPDLFSFDRRQYRIYGRGGASIRTSSRGSVSLSGGAQRTLYSGRGAFDHTDLFGTVAYDHTLSPRTSVGAHVSATRTDYSGSDDRTTAVTVAGNLRTVFSEDWFATATLGVTFSDEQFAGSSSNSTDLSGRGSVCRNNQRERLCVNVSRQTQASAQSTLVTSSTIDADWSRQIDDRQTVRLSAGHSWYSGDRVLNQRLESRYWRAAASYDRRIDQRLAAGATASVRRFNQTGFGSEKDVSGAVFVSYRLGDIG